MASIKKKNLTLGIKLGYGLAEASSCIVMTLFLTYSMLYLTDIVKLSPAFSGSIVAIGILFGAIINPIVGIVSDNLKSKWGRRRPFILGTAIPLSFIVWLFFTKINFSNHLYTEIYYLVLVLLYFLFFTLLETPHLALSAEMAQDYNERTNILAWRSFMGQIGSILAGPVIILLYDYLKKTQAPSTAVSISVGILCVLSVPLVLISWYTTKDTELLPEKTSFHFKDIFNGPLSNRSFIYLTIAFSFAMCAATLKGAVGIYYLSYVIKLTNTQISIVMFILFGLSIIWIPGIDIVCNKLGKRIGWTIFIGMWAVSEGLFVQFLLKPGDIISTYIVFFFIGGGITGIYMIGLSMISDCIEIDEFKTGERREGIYFGLMYFVQCCSCAFVMWVTGMVLSGIGYKADVNQSLSVQNWLIDINGITVATILIVSIVFCWFVPITKKRHNALREAIALKKEGKEYDTSMFEDII